VYGVCGAGPISARSYLFQRGDGSDDNLFQRAPANGGHTPLLPLLNSAVLLHEAPRTYSTVANNVIRRYVRTDLLVLVFWHGLDYKCTAVALFVLTVDIALKSGRLVV